VDGDKQEVRKLKKLLTQRLSYSERIEIERRLRELRGEQSDSSPSRPISPYLLGVWDKPAPTQPEPAPEPEARPDVPATSEKAVAEQASKADAAPTTQDLSPEEAESIAATIATLGERIVELRSFWARTLSLEVEQQAEACLTRLQQLATQIPRDLAEVALGSHASLLTQKTRDVKKPQVSQDIQLNVLPPSVPSLDVTGTWTDLYYAFANPRQPRPQHPAGYVPDGLQQFL
jgi:hypothetical protein